MLSICALAALLAVSVAWAYAPSFRGVLVLDDVRAIVRNPTIATLWPLSRPLSPPAASTVAGRPVANFTFAVNYALAPADARHVFAPGGPNAPAGTAELFRRNIWGYHLFNLLVHWAAGLTLFGIVRRTVLTSRLRARFAATATGLASAVALVWLLHPLQTAAVAYVVQRVESLMGLFYLLTLYCAIRASGSVRPRAWAAGAIASCALGMATKEVMISAPVMVALWDWTFSERDVGRVRWPLVAALAGTWLILAALVFHEHRSPSLDLSPWTVWRYLLTQAEVVTHYVRLALLPSPLVFFYSWPLSDSLSAVALPAAFLTAVAALTAYGSARRAPAAFAGAWFFLILAPTSSVLPIVTEVAAEHRMYLPLAAVLACAVLGGWIGLDALVSRLVREPPVRRRMAAAVAILLVAAAAVGCALRTRARTEDYSSDERLWRDTIEKQPTNQVARVAYAEALARAGRYPESEAELRQAMAQAPADPLARVRLGSVVAAQGRIDEAIALWEQALELRPSDVDAHSFLGRAYAMRRQESLAVRHFRQALDIAKDDPAILEQLAVILAGSGDASVRNPASAVAAADRAVQLTGRRDARALEILAIALDAAGRSSDAAATAREALGVARAQDNHALVSELESRVKTIESRATPQPAR